MNIGDAASRSGVPAKTIRYYESIGLIPQAQRSAAGYRHYEERDVRVLAFIHRARRLGFSVRDVVDLLALWQDDGRASAEVKSVALDHLTEIDRRIEELRSIRRTLKDLSERCQGDDRPDCPILDDLSGSGSKDDDAEIVAAGRQTGQRRG